MTKFKVGDRIRMKECNYSITGEGSTGTILEIEKGVLAVDFDKISGEQTGNVGEYTVRKEFAEVISKKRGRKKKIIEKKLFVILEEDCGNYEELLKSSRKFALETLGEKGKGYDLYSLKKIAVCETRVRLVRETKKNKK